MPRGVFQPKACVCAACGASYARIAPSNRYCSIACRFAAKVDKSVADGCWTWTGTPRSEFGYGGFHVSAERGDQYAHRVAWELAHGPIPDGLSVLHRCDNPPCVKTAPDALFPDGHLFLGTLQDNADDMVAKGRGNQPRGEQHGRTPFTNEDIVDIRRLWGSGVSTIQEIADARGVANYSIYQIVHRLSWKHIPETP